MTTARARTDLAKISVHNLQRAVRVNASALQKPAAEALRLCLGIQAKRPSVLGGLCEIHIILTSDRRISALHRRFLHKSGPTDVITFEHGEIFISTETARRHARRFRNSFLRELQLCIVHGLLHLHGFDDRDERAARKMEKMQQRILDKLPA